MLADLGISIHALQAESNVLDFESGDNAAWFQSTLSKRRATIARREKHDYTWNFNPRSPSGERLQGASPRKAGIYNFNPRSPSGERHFIIWQKYGLFFISIHALQAESDCLDFWKWSYGYDFNPRSPSGERRGAVHYHLLSNLISIHALQAESDDPV